MILMVVAVAQKRWIHLSAMLVASENVIEGSKWNHSN
jgi:hypothetical protein